MTDVSAELIERGGAIWDELRARCSDGPLPFAKFDPNNSEAIISFWDVAESGDSARDLTIGVYYAELLVHRSKSHKANPSRF